jgi:hypothetical protein
VRINIPLLPMRVDVRSHPISVKPCWRPLTPFRFSLRGLMLAVVVAGLYCSLCAHLVRHNSASLYHAEQAYQSSLSRYPNRSHLLAGTTLPREWKGGVMVPRGSPPVETRHRMKSIGYTADIKRLFPLVSGFSITFVSLGALAALGRVIHAWFRASVAPTTDELSLSPVGTVVERAG